MVCLFVCRPTLSPPGNPLRTDLTPSFLLVLSISIHFISLKNTGFATHLAPTTTANVGLALLRWAVLIYALSVPAISVLAVYVDILIRIHCRLQVYHLRLAAVAFDRAGQHMLMQIA